MLPWTRRDPALPTNVSVKWICLAPAIDDSFSMGRGTLNRCPGCSPGSWCPTRCRQKIEAVLKVCCMRFALRTLVPVFAAGVVITTTGFWSRSASAQTAPAKSAEAPAKNASPAAAPPAADSTTTAPPTEVVDPAPILAKGEAALKAGDYAAAIAAFNDADKAAQQAGQQGGGPETLKAQIAAQVGRGRAEVGLRDYETAEKEFRAVLQTYTNDVSALVAMGQLKLETGHPDEAIDQFQLAVKNDPTSGDALLGYGKSLVLLQHGTEAIAPLTRAIAIDPKNAEAYRLRASANALIFKNKQAFEDIHKSIELNPEDYESYFALGELDIRSEDYKGAADAIGKASELYKPKPGQEDQPFFQAYLTRASSFVELGKKLAKDSPEQKAAYKASFDEVQRLIKQLDEKNPAYSKVLAASLYSRGIAERMLGQLGPAIRTLTHAIELR